MHRNSRAPFATRISCLRLRSVPALTASTPQYLHTFATAENTPAASTASRQLLRLSAPSPLTSFIPIPQVPVSAAAASAVATMHTRISAQIPNVQAAATFPSAAPRAQWTLVLILTIEEQHKSTSSSLNRINAPKLTAYIDHYRKPSPSFFVVPFATHIITLLQLYFLFTQTITAFPGTSRCTTHQISPEKPVFLIRIIKINSVRAYSKCFPKNIASSF